MLFRSRDPLDAVLFTWDDGTPYTIREFLTSCAIFGQTGSGKSSASNLRLVLAVLLLKQSGGLILASKPEDKSWWIERFKQTGRLKDLIIFAPDSPARCNFVDYEMKCGGDPLSLTQFVMITGEFLDQDAQKGEAFWRQGQRRMLYNAIVPIKLGAGTISIPDIQRFISSAAYSEAQVNTEAWQKGFHFETMRKAAAKTKNPIEKGDFEQCHDYWTNEFLHMDDKPRSSRVSAHFPVDGKDFTESSRNPRKALISGVSTRQRLGRAASTVLRERYLNRCKNPRICLVCRGGSSEVL